MKKNKKIKIAGLGIATIVLIGTMATMNSHFVYDAEENATSTPQLSPLDQHQKKERQAIEDALTYKDEVNESSDLMDRANKAAKEATDIYNGHVVDLNDQLDAIAMIYGTDAVEAYYKEALSRGLMTPIQYESR